MPKILVVDCQLAGISGDMMLAALIDLGADLNYVSEATSSVAKYLPGCSYVKLEVKDVKRAGFYAKRAEILVDEEFRERSGEQVKHALISCAEDVGLSSEAKMFAESVINTMIEAEAKLHSLEPSKVHFHEISSADTVVDIIGVASALESLDLFKDTVMVSTHVALGGGYVEFSHGKTPAPAPATLEILKSRSFPCVGGPVEYELTTPTGAAMLVNLVSRAEKFYPEIRVERIGYGAGKRDLEGFPNVLRLVLGRTHDRLIEDEVIIVETNVDDVDGEIISRSIEKIMEAGARDVAVIPALGKKGRPCNIISIITDSANLTKVTETLFKETGTLGLRLYSVKRLIVERKEMLVDVNINGKDYKVRIKLSKDPYEKTLRVKPEYEDLKKISEATHIPLIKIKDIVNVKINKMLFKCE